MNATDRAILGQRAVEAARDRVAHESYLTVQDVMKRLDVSRAIVEGMPFEILPYTDCSSTLSSRQLRRYHPADVEAFDARRRGWTRAQQRGEGEAYLQALRDELDSAEQRAIADALSARAAAA